MTAIRYFTVQEVIAINVAVIQRYSPGEQIGVKDRGLLQSAILRPQSSVFSVDAYPSVIEKAAALFESLGQNHPFHNANKRTAFTALVIFLRYNGYLFDMEHKAAADLTVDMVNHAYTFEELTVKIQEHCGTR